MATSRERVPPPPPPRKADDGGSAAFLHLSSALFYVFLGIVPGILIGRLWNDADRDRHWRTYEVPALIDEAKRMHEALDRCEARAHAVERAANLEIASLLEIDDWREETLLLSCPCADVCQKEFPPYPPPLDLSCVEGADDCARPSRGDEDDLP